MPVQRRAGDVGGNAGRRSPSRFGGPLAWGPSLAKESDFSDGSVFRGPLPPARQPKRPGARLRGPRTGRDFIPPAVRRRGATLAVGWCSCVAVVGAMIGGCQSAGTREGDLRAVRINDFRRELLVTGRMREQEQDSKVGAGSTSSRERTIEEALKLTTEGSVYHPNFLEFSLAGLFGLLQEDFESEFDGRRRTSGDEGDILEFDLEGRFLKKKPFPGTVYARRYRALEPRPFLSSLETTTTNYGFVWRYVHPKAPTSLQYNSTDVRLDPLDEEEESGRQKNTTLRLETGYRFSEHHTLSFVYDRRTVEEVPFALHYDSDELKLSHRLDFGKDHQHRLESELNAFDQRGTFDIERWRWREVLRLTHGETLRSWYQFEYQDRTQGTLSGVPPIGEKMHLMSGTLEHRLYESLVSQLFVFGQWQNFDDGLDVTRYGVQPSLDYRKKNPWGVLLSNYAYRWQKEDREGGTREVEVIDERIVLTDPGPATLSSTNVQITSMVVTDAERITRYELDRDYRIRVLGDQVEIERVPTGRIADGQTVLVDYLHLIGGDFALDTQTHHLAVRQNFAFGLSPYYRFRRQGQDISPREAEGFRIDNIESHLGGLEWQRGPIRWIGEYEDHASTINPFRAVRTSADLQHELTPRGSGRLRARWSDINRTGDQDRRIRFLTVEERYRQRVGNSLTVEAAVLYRTEEDSISGNDEGVDVDFSLEWLIRQTEVRITYEYGQFEDDFAQNRNQTLYVQFRRKF